MHKRAMMAAFIMLLSMTPAVATAAVSSPSPWGHGQVCFGDLSPLLNPLQAHVMCWKQWGLAHDQASANHSQGGISVWLIINRASWVMIFGLSTRVVFILWFSSKHHRASKRLLQPRLWEREQPLVSIIVPCYNEGPTLANCVHGLMSQTYHHTEIILVDDGSKDNTWNVARQLAGEYDLITLHKENGGKASALRYGIDRCTGSIVVCIDADSIFVPDTVEQLMRSLEDPNVTAVGGNVRVANRSGVLTACQALDYIIGLNSNGRAYSQLGCMQVIPGAIGAFRKDAYYAVGGHSHDTLVEDMDLTIAFAQHGYRVIFNPHALAYTEAPVTLKDFLNQRYRWTYGGMQVLGKYKRSMFLHWNPMGMIGMPMHMISPWINIIVSMLLLNSVVAAIFEHKVSSLVIFLGAMYLLQFVTLTYMLTIDRETKRFLFMTGVETIFYIHLLNFVTVRSGINYIFHRQAKWDKIPRLGTNQLQKGQEGHAKDSHIASPAADLEPDLEPVREWFSTRCNPDMPQRDGRSVASLAHPHHADVRGGQA